MTSDVRPQRPRAGVLAAQHLEDLIATGRLAGDPAVQPAQVQPASVDLRLGAVGYRVQASFLPGERATVRERLEELRMHELDLTRPCVLEKGCVYIVPLAESLDLPETLAGKANPKSTTGRLDIFTRLIVDRGTEFDVVPAGYRGPLYVEIVPRTFSVLVSQGTKLNQLRLVLGAPDSNDAVLDELHEREGLVFADGGTDAAGRDAARISGGLWIGVDLRGPDGADLVGHRARAHAPLIDLSRLAHYDPREFWEPIPRPGRGRLILNPDDFYILVSRERVRVPPRYAAEMVPYEPAIGEFRVHYAGFFDPGFGHGAHAPTGTRAVLEVRSHEVPFVLEDGQVVGRLRYERLLEEPTKLYGADIGSSYGTQTLRLAKQFR
ncbi:2'-deoxycytidine 5'-triphosphate deaminase [Roseisolibacter sp. H3M3-2]|uniref:2'-deoxycytidine 5'-triphosphate deaminase n=1 Tax=Roseisolibacter sp. H3M3-2 TaxID=3031323 RepID=UPI0023DCD1C1|nr:2'-deoxycytidine 5'-triphosphate deaminase [Roseisolibacter sp. H3M3-2]